MGVIRNDSRNLPFAAALMGVIGCISLASGVGSMGCAPPAAATQSSSTASNSVATNNSANGDVQEAAQPAAAANVIPVTLGGKSVCGIYGYPNEPCVSITICEPGTKNCQVVTDLLVDTGSVGIRIFAQAVTLSLPQVTDSKNKAVAECVQFGTGTTWGPVMNADVGLGGEALVRTPIQVVSKSYATVPSQCSSTSSGPTASGYNGIIGVGLFQQDCGRYCAQVTNNQTYYSCSGSSCTQTMMPLASQLQNPVGLLPTDNNGVVLQLPKVGSIGAATASGSLILGIGTQSNNQPTGVNAYATDQRGNFTTVFNGQTLSTSFIDSGSNGLFFPKTADMPNCSSQSSTAGFYCPSSTQTLTAVNISAAGDLQFKVTFQIAHALQLFSTGNTAFSNVGGYVSLPGFDWGLPIFFGRKIYTGIESTKSPLGTGPYWAL